MTTQPRLQVGSLFAGIGGFDLAAERAGMEVVFQSEVDRHASAVLDHHWPAVKNLGDVHGITTAPGVDVLTGGFPCQDYSVAGRGAGLAGDRGALWWQFHRLIAELNPRWVVAENVDGLTNRTHRASLRTIIGSLVSLGYGVVWRVLDAGFFGVAQGRKRVFVVGSVGGQPRPEILALAEGVSGGAPPSREAGSQASALTANGLGGGGPDDNLAQAHHLVPAQASTLTQGAPNAGRRQEDDYNLVAFAQNQRDELRPLTIASSLNAERWGTAKNETLLASPAGVRRLTPLECERLQGFPDHWTDIPGNSDTQRYRQLGNAVAVPVVEWILNRLVEVSE